MLSVIFLPEMFLTNAAQQWYSSSPNAGPKVKHTITPPTWSTQLWVLRSLTCWLVEGDDKEADGGGLWREHHGVFLQVQHGGEDKVVEAGQLLQLFLRVVPLVQQVQWHGHLPGAGVDRKAGYLEWRESVMSYHVNHTGLLRMSGRQEQKQARKTEIRGVINFITCWTMRQSSKKISNTGEKKTKKAQAQQVYNDLV